MNDNGYFSSEQSGFLRLHSTVTSLDKSTDNWYSGMDLGKLIGVVFIGLKKVFDTVDHDILCQKLEYYGNQGRDLAWFRSHLSNRPTHLFNPRNEYWSAPGLMYWTSFISYLHQ